MPAVLFGALAMVLAVLHGPILAARLPEPDDGHALGKLPYTALKSPLRVVCLLVVTLVAQVATIAGPTELRPVWLIYGASVTALVWVDAFTSWLPAILNWLVTVELVVAVGVGLLLSNNPATLALHLIGGAAASLGFWWLFWRLGRGALGFGDVRLGPLAGAVAATLGSHGWVVGLLASAIVGVLWGLVIGRNHPAPGTARGFAYGPAIWVGPYIALLWTSLVG